MPKKLLTDLTVQKARVKRGGKDLMLWDALSPGLCLVVRPSGTKLFKLITAYPGSRGWCKRTLGRYPVMGLKEAREKVVDWRKLIAKHVDPRDEERRRKQQALRARAHTFDAVLQRYADEHLAKLRRGAKDKQEIEREILPAWRHRLLTDISRADVVELIKPVAKRAPTSAHLMLNHIKRIFSWAVADGSYGLEQSPAVLVKPKQVIGEKRSRTRVLNNAELKAFWHGCDSMGGAYGALFQIIALTGTRVGEAVGAQWKEFDFKEGVWRIPAARYKAGQEHAVAVSDTAAAVLKSLKRFKGCPYVFTVNGVNAVNGLSKAKSILDAAMLKELRKDDPEAELSNFVLHDLRRTCRSRLSELRVPDHVAEMVLGHGRRGLQRVYDQHGYESEMREALQRWAAHLERIVSGKPAKVVKLRA